MLLYNGIIRKTFASSTSSVTGSSHFFGTDTLALVVQEGESTSLIKSLKNSRNTYGTTMSLGAHHSERTTFIIFRPVSTDSVEQSNGEHQLSNEIPCGL